MKKTVVNTFGSIAEFMRRYSQEAVSVAGALRTILFSLPLAREDKAQVESVIETLEKAAISIAAFTTNNPTIGEPVRVKASDVKAAIVAYLEANPDIIAAAVADAMGNGEVRENENV